jgi:hypothetical protein
VARAGQGAKRRAKEKTALVEETTPPRSVEEILAGSWVRDLDPFVAEFTRGLYAFEISPAVEGYVSTSSQGGYA